MAGIHVDRDCIESCEDTPISEVLARGQTS
jgi:hypothetical protein